MLQSADLDAAVSEGILTADQATALRALAERRERERAIALGPEEEFRFVRGFNDIFFTIGILLFLVGLVYFVPWTGIGMAFVAGVVWLLAELLVARRRLVLPGIVLATNFVMFVFIAAVYMPLESWVGAMVPPAAVDVPTSILQGLQFYPGGSLAFAARALVAAAAAGVFYLRFGLPFALLPLGLGLVVAVAGVASYLLPMAAGVSETLVFLACGLGVFAVAMSFDISDRERRTRRAHCAFWLHLLAAPLIVHSVMSLVTTPLAGAIGRLRPIDSAPVMSGNVALAYVVVVALLALVAVLIDRRAMLVSGLAYLGGAIAWTLADGGSSPGFAFFATLVVLGAFVLTLGTAWVPLRRALLGLVPPVIGNRLPPVPARP